MINDRDTGGALTSSIWTHNSICTAARLRDGRAKIPGPIVDIDVQINEP